MRKMKKSPLLITAIVFVLTLGVLMTFEVLRARFTARSLLRINLSDLGTSITDGADFWLLSTVKELAAGFGSSGKVTNERLKRLLEEYSVSIICDVGEDAVIKASSEDGTVGFNMLSSEQSREFVEMLKTESAWVQNEREMGYDGKRVFKFAAAAYPEDGGFVQAGWSEDVLNRYIVQRVLGLTRSRHIDQHGYIVMANHDGKIVSHISPALIGMDFHEVTGLVPGSVEKGAMFEMTLDGTAMFAMLDDVRDFIALAIVPKSDIYDSRNMIMPIVAVTLGILFTILYFTMRAVFAANDRETAFAYELDFAKTIQMSALPAEFPSMDGFQLAAGISTAREVGGDFYDYFPLDENHYAFLIADVSGKGITAALYMMNAKTLIKETLHILHDPALAMEKVNRELCRNNPANMFLTAWIGVLDLRTGDVEFANAGHNSPVLVSPGEDPRFLEDVSGRILAISEDMKYKSFKIHLKPGDTIFLYTDGVTEAMDPKGDFFGDERLVETVKYAQESHAESPERLISVVRASLAVFTAGAPTADDIATLALRRVPANVPVERTFEPTNKGIALAEAFLDETLSIQNPDLHIMLDEVCSNIVKYSKATMFKVAIDESSLDGEVELTFTDDGIAYNPLEHTDPNTYVNAQSHHIGGLGILILKHISSRARYSREHGFNILKVSSSR